MTLKDAQAKAILADRKKWPNRTKSWEIPGYKGYWVKACPCIAVMPYIHGAGAAANTTHPDGMYLFVHESAGFADVIAIEVCLTNQNFNDKRSRYTPTSGNVQVTLPLEWLDHSIPMQKSGSRKIWEASNWFLNKPIHPIKLTIRHLRILFVLTDTVYSTFGKSSLPAGHEYFCRHRDLGQINHKYMQEFIKGMALMKHFRVKP